MGTRHPDSLEPELLLERFFCRETTSRSSLLVEKVFTLGASDQK
jgi:hypothetical protein